MDFEATQPHFLIGLLLLKWRWEPKNQEAGNTADGWPQRPSLWTTWQYLHTLGPDLSWLGLYFCTPCILRNRFPHMGLCHLLCLVYPASWGDRPLLASWAGYCRQGQLWTVASQKARLLT